MSITPLWGYQAAQLLAGTTLCNGCLKAPGPGGPELPPSNALVIDPASPTVVHAGDAVTGETACGHDANRWTWIMPANPTPPPAVEPA